MVMRAREEKLPQQADADIGDIENINVNVFLVHRSGYQKLYPKAKTEINHIHT